MIDKVANQQDELSANVRGPQNYQCCDRVIHKPRQHPSEEKQVLDTKLALVLGGSSAVIFALCQFDRLRLRNKSALAEAHARIPPKSNETNHRLFDNTCDD